MSYFLLMLGIAGLYLDYMGAGNIMAAGSLMRQELFTDSPPFYKWLGAFIIVGMLGYVDELKPVATAMLILIILSIVMTKNRPSVTSAIVAHL